MKIGWIRRLHLTYAFWKAFGADRNGVIAILHDGGFGDISAWNLSDEMIEEIQKQRDRMGEGHGH